MPQGASTSEGTLGVILGASQFPKQPNLTPSKAFLQSASEIKEYFLSPQGLALPSENLLYLFDSDDAASAIDETLSTFLKNQQAELESRGVKVQDLIVYYVGHGGFSKPDNVFFLALRATRLGNEGSSSYLITSLANTLREEAAFLRRYLILDSCFSAAAYAAFQSAPLEVAKQQTLDEFPDKGTCLLCAAGPKDPAKSLPGQVHTMFSGALLYSLQSGSSQKPDRLSFSDLGELTRNLIKKRFPDEAVRPEMLSPDQRQGDIATLPLFPNAAKQPEEIDKLRDKLNKITERYDDLEKRYIALENSGRVSKSQPATVPEPSPTAGVGGILSIVDWAFDVGETKDGGQPLVYKRKIRVVLRNEAGKQIEVQTPDWAAEAGDLAIQPTGSVLGATSKIRPENQQTGGWKRGKWYDEVDKLILPAAHHFQAWVGLSNCYTTETLDWHRREGRIGTLVFWVTVDRQQTKVRIRVT